MSFRKHFDPEFIKHILIAKAIRSVREPRAANMLIGMSRDVQWTDSDPETGERRFVSVEMFARKWEFKTRAKRRENWRRLNPVPREMWETLLEALERRYHRREGVTDADLAEIRRILSTYKPAPIPIVEADAPESI